MVGRRERAVWGREKVSLPSRSGLGSKETTMDELQQFFSLGSGVTTPATAEVDDGKPKVIALV